MFIYIGVLTVVFGMYHIQCAYQEFIAPEQHDYRINAQSSKNYIHIKQLLLPKHFKKRGYLCIEK